MKQVIRSVFNKLGIEIRLIKSVQAQLRDAFMEQQSLIGKNNAKVIFDVGAYDGGTAIKYHKYFPLANVYSFEPFAKSFIKLDETASKNSFIIPINAAASDKVDIANLYVNNMDATNSLLPSAITNSYLDGLTKLDHIESVITTTIDQICIERNIDFIDILKIDVQGGGLEVHTGQLLPDHTGSCGGGHLQRIGSNT
jgi:FkbM family methyltransferase